MFLSASDALEVRQVSDMTMLDPVVALREALERLRVARSTHESAARLDAYNREVQLRLEAVIRQTRPRAVKTFRN
jgi:hypothetical protein